MVDLPFVPVTWMDGKPSSGWSSRSHSAAMRSRSGSGMCSGARPFRSRVAAARSTTSPASAEPFELLGERRLAPVGLLRLPLDLGTDVGRGLLHERGIAEL